jgi:hypothetical protein
MSLQRILPQRTPTTGNSILSAKCYAPAPPSLPLASYGHLPLASFALMADS